MAADEGPADAFHSSGVPQLGARERVRFHSTVTASPRIEAARPGSHAAPGNAQLEHGASTSTYESALSQWRQECAAANAQWRNAWSAAIDGMPTVETDPQEALRATAATLAEAANPAVASLNLHYLPLPRFPEQTDRLSHLEHMTISAAGLLELPQSMQDLANLQTLVLEQNPIRSLPASISYLSQLRQLSIVFCPDLTELPRNLAMRNASGQYEGLINLQALQLLGTGIRILPTSVMHLENLKRLQVMHSPLAQLAINIHHMPRLEELDLQGSALRDYPPVARGRAPLKRLNLQDCSELVTLPVDIHTLTQLEELDLRGCNRLQALPLTISALPAACTIRVPPHLQAQLDRLRQHIVPPRQDRTGPIGANPHPATTIDPAGASSSGTALTGMQARKDALEKIDDTAHALLSVVIDDERNPFIEGAPSYRPDKRPPGTPATLGEVAALKKMLDESKDPDFQTMVQQMAGDTPRVEGMTSEDLSDHYTAVSNWKAQQNAHLGIVDHLGQYVYHQESEMDASTLAKAVQMWKTRELLVAARPQDRRQFPSFPLYLPEHAHEGSDGE
ncbi:leucine-rich repeat domain-containing protein [Xanthomonas campestris pv. asclepiadis]|nr:type III secretion system leucine-rich repeat domain-containing effector XopL [Xanthomonas campestris]MCC4614568.1 leucine-rich repeat domain-containing protein [Xanthomonas campestris pv. asclepiadis]